MNNVKKIDIKNDMININNENPNNEKVDQKFGDVTPNSVNP